MDTIIQDASKGSPILAYGRSSLSSKNRIILLVGIIVGIIAIFILGFLSVFYLGSAQLPSKPLLAISVTPSSINTRLNGALIAELPAPWRSAIESGSSLPVIVGVAETKDGSASTFAIVPRTTSIASADHASIHVEGLVKTIVSDGIETSRTPYRTLSKLLRARKHADAGWMISERLMRLMTGDRTSDAVADVYGSISGNHGEIFLATDEASMDAPESAFFVMIGKQKTQTRLLSNALLSQGIDVKDLPDPERILLKGDGTLNTAWSDLSEDDRRLVAVASQKTTTTTFELPDKEAVKRIAPSDQSGLNDLAIGNAWKQSSGEEMKWKTSCPGMVRFSINGEALQNLLIMSDAPSSWREKIQSFVITTNHGKSGFCVNE